MIALLTYSWMFNWIAIPAPTNEVTRNAPAIRISG